MAASVKLNSWILLFTTIKSKSTHFCRIYMPKYQFVRGLRSVKYRKLNIEEEKYQQLMKEFKSEQMSENFQFSNPSKSVNMLHHNMQHKDVNEELQSSVKQKTENDINKVEDKKVVTHQSTTASVLEVTTENQFDLLSERVTPLAKLPYNLQLKRKYWNNILVLKKFGEELKNIKAKIAIGKDNLPCGLDYVVPSPVIKAYRNKDEFSIRCGVDGNMKTVGFFLQSSADNPQTICVGPDHLVNIKDCHKYLAKMFEKYIQASPLPACFNFYDGGHWRNIIVRSNIYDEVMGIIVMHPQDLTEEQLEEEKDKLRSYFSSVTLKECNLKSLYFQACRHTRCTNAEAPFQKLLGDLYITEELCGYKFRISPESFFQTNTAAAEQLYKVLFKACGPHKSASVLDVCCGMGPISLIIAPYVKKCIGIDVSVQAIEDAKFNAKLNNITNAEFYCGKSEHLLSEILNNTYSEEWIVILNPSRSAFGKSVIHSLRECRYIKKVIYVSCNPSAAIPNFIQLSKTSSSPKQGAPFLPLKAIPVDLFPQTDHSELVIVFQRI